LGVGDKNTRDVVEERFQSKAIAVTKILAEY
jgi:hypothetical protein